MKPNQQMIQGSKTHIATPPPVWTKPKTGTAEWAATTLNILKGCRHNCRYCYARCDALRFGRIHRGEDWTKEEIKTTFPKIRKFPERVMFPSTHDITPDFIEECVCFLHGLLSAGNEVLIVSKPHYYCIERLCREFSGYKTQITFRFTIGSTCNDCTSFWEPGAPSPAERIACLKHAHQLGYLTSVSIEPMLAGANDAIDTFYKLEPHVREKIWIGKMNQISRRVDLRDPRTREVCNQIRELQSDAEILRLVKALEGEPKVEWKDSIRHVVEQVNAKISKLHEGCATTGHLNIWPV